MDLKHYNNLARLFEYPHPGFAQEVKEVQDYLDRFYPKAGDELMPFTNCVARLSVPDLEELFCRSFDVQAVTTLDLGYVLFGDDYKRGALLVNLNAEHRDAGVECGTELSDHLSNVLKLVASIQKPDVLHELMEIIIQPALRKILFDFEPDMIDRKTQVYERHHRTIITRPETYGLIYKQPIQAALTVMESDFKVRRIEPAEKTSDFLRNVNREIEIEPIN